MFDRLGKRLPGYNSGDSPLTERMLFPSLVVLVALNLITSLIAASSVFSLLQARASTREADTIHTLLERVYIGMLNGETGQRGYIITGDQTYLVPYSDGIKAVPGAISQLNKSVTDPTLKSQLNKLERLTDKKINGMQESINVRRAQGYDAAAALIKSNTGKATMDETRRLLDTMEARANKDIASKDAKANRMAVIAFSSLAFAVIFIAVLVYFILVLFKQFQRANKQLETTNEELNRSNRELQDFASVASHDLQEPLRKIQAFGDRLESTTTLSEDSKEYLDRMLAAAGRMRILIDDLLAFSRVTTKAQPFKRVSLRRITNEVLSDLEIKVEDTGAKVTVGKLPAIDADELQMRQLLQNLLSNALKFTRPDVKPSVKVHATKSHMDGREVVILTVEDNGIGFDPKYLDRIFTIFQRLHGRSEYEGTGIGLAVVRKIAERHEGGVTAESEEGKGSRFIVTLPVHHNKSAE